MGSFEVRSLVLFLLIFDLIVCAVMLGIPSLFLFLFFVLASLLYGDPYRGAVATIAQISQTSTSTSVASAYIRSPPPVPRS